MADELRGNYTIACVLNKEVKVWSKNLRTMRL